MSKSATCTGTALGTVEQAVAIYGEQARQWYGRRICTTCGGAVLGKADGSARKHVEGSNLTAEEKATWAGLRRSTVPTTEQREQAIARALPVAAKAARQEVTATVDTEADQLAEAVVNGTVSFEEAATAILSGKAPKAKKAKRGRDHSQQGKDNGEKARDAAPVAEAIIAEVSADVAAQHALGKRVKELRDGGMAWWQIGHELGLPGSGPNVASGKGGASRARTLYKKTFGELPGGTVARSTKASRKAAVETGEAPVVRKPLFSAEELADLPGLVDRVAGHEVRWVGRVACSDGSEIATEREARFHPKGVTAVANGDGRVVINFRQMDKGDHRAQQWGAIYADTIYDIRK